MKRERLKQQAFGFTNWGGKRRGAGRKPKGKEALVSHNRRDDHKVRFPLHVTLKLATGLPSLRKTAPFQVVQRALVAAADRFGCRVVHYSVQSNHLHLIVEAEDNRAVARAMNGLSVRIAHGLNKLWKRTGSVFADRFHSRALRTPTDVRNVLLYVLRNTERHGVTYLDGPDPFTSGESFDGWKRPLDLADSSLARLGGMDATRAAEVRALFGQARTWLLRVGWQRHGLLDWVSSARSSRASSARAQRRAPEPSAR
jgi:REP element-mobilizing transposase RayT